MSPEASAIVEDIVGKQQKEGLGQTVDQFGRSVEQEAKERTDALREVFGESVDQLIGDTMKEAQSYHQAKNELLDPNATVSDISKTHGAAGMVDMTTRVKTLDDEAMAYDVANEDYWKRVDEHERIHQEEQAAVLNQQEVTFVNESGELETVEADSLVEWHPSSEANEPEDLTPDYQEMVDEGNKVAESLGSDGDAMIKEALKTGDIQGLQTDIINRQREKIIDAFSQDLELQTGA